MQLVTDRPITARQALVTGTSPLADGIAPIPDYLQRLREGGYHGIYTLHSEYTDKNSWKQLTIDECLEQTRLDFEFTKRCLKDRG